MTRIDTTFSRLEKVGRAGEDAVLVIILTAMILLAASQIVLRNFFNFGFIWADEMLRMLVLWIAVAGAVAASRTDKHINISILDRFLPDRGAKADPVCDVRGLHAHGGGGASNLSHGMQHDLLGRADSRWARRLRAGGFGVSVAG